MLLACVSGFAFVFVLIAAFVVGFVLVFVSVFVFAVFFGFSQLLALLLLAAAGYFFVWGGFKIPCGVFGLPGRFVSQVKYFTRARIAFSLGVFRGTENPRAHIGEISPLRFSLS